MKLRLRHILVICLALLVVVGSVHVGHLAHASAPVLLQSHHCDHPGDAPFDSDCADACPLCQISLKDVALLPPLPSIVQPVKIAKTLGAFVEVALPSIHSATGERHARAPPPSRTDA
jgi:hypothetical protein